MIAAPKHYLQVTTTKTPTNCMNESREAFVTHRQVHNCFNWFDLVGSSRHFGSLSVSVERGARMTDRQQPLLVLYGRHIMVVVGSSQLVGSGHGRVKHLCSTPQLSSYVVRDDNRVRVQAFGQPGVVRDDRQLRPSSLHLLAACSHLSHKTAVCPANVVISMLVVVLAKQPKGRPI